MQPQNKGQKAQSAQNEKKVNLTLKGIPENVMEKIRAKAYSNRRSINQQVILLMEEAA